MNGGPCQYQRIDRSRLLPIANYHATVSVIENGNGSALKVMASYDAKGVPDADAKRAADDAMYRSICVNSPLLCSPDQRSVAPARVGEI